MLIALLSKYALTFAVRFLKLTHLLTNLQHNAGGNFSFNVRNQDVDVQIPDKFLFVYTHERHNIKTKQNSIAFNLNTYLTRIY